MASNILMWYHLNRHNTLLASTAMESFVICRGVCVRQDVQTFTRRGRHIFIVLRAGLLA